MYPFVRGVTRRFAYPRVGQFFSLREVSALSGEVILSLSVLTPFSVLVLLLHDQILSFKSRGFFKKSYVLRETSRNNLRLLFLYRKTIGVY